jgi:hypothetical protein
MRAKWTVQPVFTSVVVKGVLELPGRVNTVMLNQVDLEETRRFLGVLKPCKDSDGAV